MINLFKDKSAEDKTELPASNPQAGAARTKV